MESLYLEKCGGYNALFLNELLDEYECPVCKMALREPILTLCGHRLCFSCSEELKKRNYGILVCPLDKTILSSEKIFPDKFTERVILHLKVKCDNFLKSCQWTGELKTINKHLTSCEYQEVKCLNEPCSATLLQKELSDHMEKHCIYRLVTCCYCKQEIIFCDNQIHEEECECLPLCCENQCGVEILRKEMSSHITDSCANTIIPCQYLNIGCNFKGMRKEHETHANSSMQSHLSMAILKLDAFENKVTLSVDALENKISSIVKSFETEIALKTFALENKITSTVDALKKILISKVDAQKNMIMSHEKNLEIIKAFLAVETPQFVQFFSVFDEKTWYEKGENKGSLLQRYNPYSSFETFHKRLPLLIKKRLSQYDAIGSERRQRKRHIVDDNDKDEDENLHLHYLRAFEKFLQCFSFSKQSPITYGTLYSQFKASSEMQKKLLDN